VSLYGGLICPREHAKTLIRKIHECHIEGVKADLEENGKRAVIIYNTVNIKSFMVIQLSFTVECLKSYAITENEIHKVFSEELPQVEF